MAIPIYERLNPRRSFEDSWTDRVCGGFRQALPVVILQYYSARIGFSATGWLLSWAACQADTPACCNHDHQDLRTGMNLGADDYLTKPAGAEEVLSAIRARLDRHSEKEQAAMARVEMNPNFASTKPLEALGITPSEAEVLLWIAQGKSNLDIATILG